MTQLDRVLASVSLLAFMAAVVTLGLAGTLSNDQVNTALALIVGVIVPSPLVTRGNRPPE